jgi:glycosyltransferase involved in cell wall biosynthesis
LTIHLLVPAPFDAISGGYIYDRRMVEGLRALDERVEVVELPGRHPAPDEAAEAGAREAIAALPADARILIDGLGLPAFLPLAQELASRRAIALIHHPTALEHGAEEATRTVLKAKERALFAACARLVCTSPLTARRVAEEFGVEAERIGVVEPGTDEAPRAAGSGGPGCAILSVGTLVPRKGHDVLLRALGRLSDLEWSLTIAGDDRRDATHAQTLRALAEELGIAQRVTFAGEVAGYALEALYHQADLFALATRWEGYGMAAAEAMARGLPLAITAGGAIAEVVVQGSAIVSPVDDHMSLSKGMRRPIFDHGLRAEMADVSWQGGQRLPRWTDRADAFRAELDKAFA